MKSLFDTFFKKAPIVFPLVSLFFILITIYDFSFWFGDRRVDMVYWLKPILILCYALLWIGSNLLKKWAATTFIVLTSIHLLLFLFMKEDETIMRITDNFLVTPLPVNIGLCVIILFYYRKMK